MDMLEVYDKLKRLYEDDREIEEVLKSLEVGDHPDDISNKIRWGYELKCLEAIDKKENLALRPYCIGEGVYRLPESIVLISGDGKIQFYGKLGKYKNLPAYLKGERE